MTKRAVWMICLAALLLGAASVAYRLAAPTHFDAIAWQTADEPAEFLNRRSMVPDVNRMFGDGSINSKQSAVRYLGKPQRGDVVNDTVWLYDLGSERHDASPGQDNFLELTFDTSDRLVRHRITEDWLAEPAQ